jgi:hypothetical protein
MTSRVPDLVVYRACALTSNVRVLDAAVKLPGLGGRQCPWASPCAEIFSTSPRGI